MTSTTLRQTGAETAPIACSLTAEHYRNRAATLSALAGRALTARRPIDGGERLTFTATPPVQHELVDAVAAEAACCPFLRMELRRESDVLVLDVTGPADAQPIIAELFA